MFSYSKFIVRKHVAIAIIFIGSLALYFQLNRLGFLPPPNYFLSIFQEKKSLNSDRLYFLKSEKQLLNYNRSISNIIPLSTLDKSQSSIVIEKSKRRLTFYYKQKPIKSYPVVFGGSPNGDKLKEGDLKTPEGIFQIQDLYPHSSWSKFLWLNYPDRNSWQKHLQAKREGKINWLSRIGSEVGIHGVPQGKDNWIDEGLNWTWGCISLKNKDIDELYQVIEIGTMVQIFP
jgi:murein L,D-transpeptidase YafK